MDAGKDVHAIYLDLSKAFDKVDHGVLLGKMLEMGIEGKVLRWIKHWPLDRAQRVTLDGASSMWSLVSSGIPQGSVLGPLLFTVYMNNLVVPSPVFSLKFADDCKIFTQVSSVQDEIVLQCALDMIHEWSRVHRMTFNATKSKVVRFGKGKGALPIYVLGGRPISEMDQVKDLGVHYDVKLSFSTHCAKVANRANSVVGTIKRFFSTRRLVVLRSLYITYVRPIMEYASSAWSPGRKYSIEILESVQRRMTRLAVESMGRDYPDRLIQWDLSPLEQRRIDSDLVYFYKIYKGEMLVRNLFSNDGVMALVRDESLKATRCAVDQKLRKPLAKSLARQTSFFVRTVNPWNSLHLSTRLLETTSSFKRLIGTRS